MKLIDQIRRWWKWHSAVLWGAITGFPVIWLANPSLQALLPPKVVSAVAPLIGLIGFYSEMRKNLKARKLQTDETDEAGA